MNFDKRLQLLKEINHKREFNVAVSKLGIGYLSEKSVYYIVGEFSELGLIRFNKKDNKIICELTDKGKFILMCNNPLDELKEVFSK